MTNIFKDKNILVTGGVGSIGSEIVRQLLKYEPKGVRVLDNNETGQYELEKELKDERVRSLLGDIRNYKRVERALEDVNIVFHAAAYKHVPLCEYNPLEAINNNVYGTQNVIEAAVNTESVEKFINISTDKATSPMNTMGATKLLSEKITTWATFYKPFEKEDQAYASVRFGNVMYSRGSALPLFEEQIKAGGPVTITNPEMTRFIMDISGAVNLVLKSAEQAIGGEIFVLKMPAVKLQDLADAMVELFSPKYGHKPSDIELKEIGARAGERIDEHLMTEDESKHALETEDMFIIMPTGQLPNVGRERFEKHYPDAKPVKLDTYSSKKAELISKKDVKELLKKYV